MKNIVKKVKQLLIFPGDERKLLVKSLADSCKKNADYESKITWFEELSKNLRQHIVNLDNDNKVSETIIKTLKHEIVNLEKQNKEIKNLKELLERKDIHNDDLFNEVLELQKERTKLRTKISKQKNKLLEYKNKYTWNPINTVPKDGSFFLAYKKLQNEILLVKFNEGLFETKNGIHYYQLDWWMYLPEIK